MIKHKENATHYVWGENCDGWILLRNERLAIIQENMPPGTAEKKHFHQRAQQFFFILKGQATFDINGETQVVIAQQGIHIEPNIIHCIY